ncbi:vasopressin V2 receptor-like [Palaemon carinicauda]|uniref:vasopressin V2 receptor-like n=1 Tax=Palaemon carinicauda TaxID=392227 RepID=UPI0035B5D098
MNFNRHNNLSFHNMGKLIKDTPYSSDNFTEHLNQSQENSPKKTNLEGWSKTLLNLYEDISLTLHRNVSDDAVGNVPDQPLEGDQGLHGWPMGPPSTYPGSPYPINGTIWYNDTMITTNVPDVLGPHYHKQLRKGILGIMFVVALIGNCLVMCKLRHKWSKRGRMTIMSFNLTLADLLVVVITILGQLMWELLDRQWYLSNVACKLFKVASTFAITSSNYMLVAIAIDRHEAVVRPLNPFISAKNLALAAWAVSLLPSLPNFFVFFRYEDPVKGEFCVSKFYTNDLDLNFRKVYLMMVLVLVFISCQVFVLIFYLRIYYTIWRKSSYFKRGQSDSRRTNSLLPKAKTKTLNMTITIVTAFYITNTPYVIQELVMAFGDVKSFNPETIALFGIISASNSCLNPFIYLFFSPKSETRSPESYRVTFTRRDNTVINGQQNGSSSSTRASLVSTHSHKTRR